MPSVHNIWNIIGTPTVSLEEKTPPNNPRTNTFFFSPRLFAIWPHVGHQRPQKTEGGFPRCVCVLAPGQRSCLCIDVTTLVKWGFVEVWIKAIMEIPDWYLSLCFFTISNYSGKRSRLSSLALKEYMNYLRFFQGRLVKKAKVYTKNYFMEK